jgi:magnesium chelatase family protein
MIVTTRTHRVSGRTGARTAAPHTIADVGLIGDGQGPRPGDVSQAHHGMLWLDARPACRRHVLEVLRQPLEERLTERQSPERRKSL